MNLPRYIVKKPLELNEEDEGVQEDYESRSEYFVTSHTIRPTVQRAYNSPLSLVRFGIEYFRPRNCAVLEEDGNAYGIPIHDACWKIFERVCTLRLGGVDLQGFVALWWVCTNSANMTFSN